MELLITDFLDHIKNYIMKYLVIDASLNGTGIRDKYEGGYIKPEDLQLKIETTKRLKDWLLKYENEHYDDYRNKELVDQLDKEGKELAQVIKKELTGIKIEYFSSALIKRYMIPLPADPAGTPSAED
jgi:hypothetical protein